MGVFQCFLWIFFCFLVKSGEFQFYLTKAYFKYNAGALCMQQYQNSCIITPITHCIANWSMTQVARSGIRALILANNLAWLKLFFSSSGSLHPLVSVFAVRRRPSLVLLIRMLWMDMPFTGYPMQNKVSSVQHELQQENVLALNVFHLKYTFIIFLIFKDVGGKISSNYFFEDFQR